MKKVVLFSCVLLMLFSFNANAQCYPSKDKIEFADLPNFQLGDWYESWDIYYGTHGTQLVEFTDGIKGKIFLGGNSGKLFIGDTKGGKYYYKSHEAVIRALYLYKKYNCITKKYRK